MFHTQVDSEGLDSVNSHADSQHDSVVFVLSLLIGSQFIYNATGVSFFLCFGVNARNGTKKNVFLSNRQSTIPLSTR